MVTDPQGLTGSDSVQVVVSEEPNAAPSVIAVADRTAGRAPLSVAFSARGTDPDGPASEITYLWDFGDGGASQFGADASYTYRTPGTYTATVTATDGDGAFGSAEVTVVVEGAPANRPPTVQIAASPRSGTAPLAVQFSSVARDPDGQAVSTVWNFGDGTMAGGPNIAHTYRSVGTFTATVTVTDPGGETATASVQIIVSSPPAPPVGQGSPPVDETPDGGGSQGGVEGDSDTRAGLSSPKAKKIRRIKRQGLRIRVTCPEQCRAKGILRLAGERIGKSRWKRIGEGERRRLVIRLDRQARRDLLPAMRDSGVRRVKARVVLKVVMDGEKQTVRRKITLKR
jgi:PKD repeat protein